MPLKSKSQMRWMFANHPTMAKRWVKHTEDVKSLPEKISTTPGAVLSGRIATSKESTSAAGQSHTDEPQMSEKKAVQTIDLDWLDGPKHESDHAHPPETVIVGLVEAARRVKLANTLTGVLKTAFGHRTSNVSVDGDTSFYLSGLIEKVSGLSERVIEMGSELILQPAKSAGCDKSSPSTLATCNQTGLDKTAIQIPPGWQPRPMIDIQKMILKPLPGYTTPLGASIKAHDTAQAEIAAKAKPEAQAGTGTSVGPGNSPNIHPITSFSGLGPAGTVNGNASFGTANSSTKSADWRPILGIRGTSTRDGSMLGSGIAVAEALHAGLDMANPADKLRAERASLRDMQSNVRRKARLVPGFLDDVPIPGAGSFAPGTKGSNGLLQPQPPAGPPGTDLPPVMPRPSPLIKPQIKLPTDTGPLTPTPGTGLPGTNALETPFAGIGGQLKVAQPSTRSAVLVTGNPKFIRDNPKAEAFYASLEKHLQGAGFRTSRDPGEPHTMPQPADLWIGHSRGAGRFEYAPATQKYLSFGSSRPGSINHPGDTAMQPGDTPTDEHYVVTPEMRTAIDQLISESGSQLKVADLLPGGLGDNKPDRDFASSSLLQGIKHETEHTKRRPIAKEIAKDHLSEDPAYYRKLEQVENPRLADEPKLPKLDKLPKLTSRGATLGQSSGSRVGRVYQDSSIARELAQLGYARRTMSREQFMEWLARPEDQLKAAIDTKALWNHPARPFVTQAAAGAGTSLALNEVLRRAIEAYQGKPTDPDTIHRERLMAAGMGAGMGLSREAMPHIANAAQPYVEKLIG